MALLESAAPKAMDSRNSPRRGWGGIVPHAGWICSGAIAGQTIATLARMNRELPPELVVVFGAVHTPIDIDRAALDIHHAWHVPGGDSQVDLNLGRELAGSAEKWFVADERLHRHEHAVEVELPLIQAAWPGAMLMPIEIPLMESAADIGRETARQVLSLGKRAVFLASSDLTHYGPAYRFVPAGIGLHGLDWALENDERLLRLITDFAPEKIVPEVAARANACGGGAIAAMLAACQASGATRADVLRHANSYQTLANLVRDDPTNAVGYAAVVVS
jgi:hypothetical protein